MEQSKSSQFDEAISPGLESFVPEFFENRKKDFNSLKELVAQADFDSARKIVHNWKGYCEPYGFGGLGLLAIDLEMALQNNNTASVQELMVKVSKYFNQKVIPLSESPTQPHA